MFESEFKYPAHNVFELNGLLFSSKFENGNLLKVEPGSTPNEYLMWVASDNYGTDYSRSDGTNAWFHFSVARVSKGTTLHFQILNVTSHSSLYKQDMRPVFKSISNSNFNWQRIRQPVKFLKETERCSSLSFDHYFDAEDDTVYFAFTYPYTYTTVQNELEKLDEKQRDVTKAVSNVDIVNDTSEPALSGLFPEFPSKLRPPLFKSKEVIFISSRVHPGEVPAQHTFKGILDFLLDETDLRAIELRNRFVFKLIPMLNPDGVYRGHFRMDQYGNNLNRYYSNPDSIQHPAIYAAKSLLDFYAAEGRLSMYLDLHSHASKRGCFIYGNIMNSVEEQVQNQLYCQLIALNTPHFDYQSCLFSKEHMARIDPGDMKKGLTAEGSGRVATYLSHGIIHSYTLECNYNTSKIGNEVPPTVENTLGQTQDFPVSAPYNTSPEKYTPQTYYGVGRACLIAMLDIRNINPCSRIPNSKYQSLDKLRAVVNKEVTLRKEFRLARMKQRSASIPRQSKQQRNKSFSDNLSNQSIEGIWKRCASSFDKQITSSKWELCADLPLPLSTQSSHSFDSADVESSNQAVIIHDNQRNDKKNINTTPTKNLDSNNGLSIAKRVNLSLDVPAKPPLPFPAIAKLPRSRGTSGTGTGIGTGGSGGDGVYGILDSNDVSNKGIGISNETCSNLSMLTVDRELDELVASNPSKSKTSDINSNDYISMNREGKTITFGSYVKSITKEDCVMDKTPLGTPPRSRVSAIRKAQGRPASMQPQSSSSSSSSPKSNHLSTLGNAGKKVISMQELEKVFINGSSPMNGGGGNLSIKFPNNINV